MGYQLMRLSPFTRVTAVLTVSVIGLVFALAACGGDGDDDASGSAGAGATPVPTLVTIPTPEPAAPDADVTDGAAANGEALFAAKACSACHSTGDNRLVGPGLAGIGETAATRVPGQTADQYLEQSIRDPGSFLVDGFDNLMPPNFADLPESEVNDLIAFLKSL